MKLDTYPLISPIHCHAGLFPDAICTNCITLPSDPYINVINFPSSPYTYLPTCMTTYYNVQGGNLPEGSNCQYYRYIPGNSYDSGSEILVDTYPTSFESCYPTELITTWHPTCNNCCYHMTMYYGWGNEGSSYTEILDFFKVCADASGCGQTMNWCNTC